MSTSPAVRRVGDAVIATGALHNALGAWLYRRPLAAIARDRGFNAVSAARLPAEERDRREAAFWFLISGTAFAVIGAALRNTDDDAVAALGPAIAAIGAVGAAAMPVSGFWLLIAEGVAATRAARNR